jgi:hypothetical protein
MRIPCAEHSIEAAQCGVHRARPCGVHVITRSKRTDAAAIAASDAGGDVVYHLLGRWFTCHRVPSAKALGYMGKPAKAGWGTYLSGTLACGNIARMGQ